jgi:alpha-mannosidase
MLLPAVLATMLYSSTPYLGNSKCCTSMAAAESEVAALPRPSNCCCCCCCQSFFTRWWHWQTPRVQDQVRQLVASGQLDFVNGGFVQHDEAAAHYAAMIDQTTRGHR